MTFPTWHEPVRLLEKSTGPATDQQREIASTVALALVGAEPQGVTAVLLEEYLQRSSGDGSQNMRPTGSVRSWSS
jgi:hypothetical protein